MLKLPRNKNVRGWSQRRRTAAWWSLHLAKRRRRRAAGEPLTLLDGLVAYWKLNEKEGEMRYDISGNGSDLTDNNIVGEHPGRIGTAAEFAFAGFDRWLDVPHGPLLRLDGDFTTSCWVYRTGSAFGSDTIFNSTGTFYFYTHESVGHRPILSVLDGMGYEVVSLLNDTIIEVDAWRHMVVYRSGSTLGIVVDAGTPATIDYPGPLPYGDMFRIGAHEGGYPFTGAIDEFGVWNRALSAEEITQLYGGGAGMTFEEF